jgi:hypothetical protein
MHAARKNRILMKKLLCLKRGFSSVITDAQARIDVVVPQIAVN